jgi:hypothetical protein
MNDDNMEDEDAEMADEQNRERPRRGNRLADQVDMDDEPPLPGYERYELKLAVWPH